MLVLFLFPLNVILLTALVTYDLHSCIRLHGWWNSMKAGRKQASPAPAVHSLQSTNPITHCTSAAMASEDKARGGPELPAGSFQVRQEHELKSSEGAIPNPQSLAQGEHGGGPRRSVGLAGGGRAVTAPASHAHLPAGSPPCSQLPVAPSNPLLHADDVGASVGATSKDVDPGFGGGPERLGAGVADVGKEKRIAAADPALQRGQQQKPA